jgi:hypothetical protein
MKTRKPRTLMLPASIRHILSEDSGFNIRRGDVYVVTKDFNRSTRRRELVLQRATLGATATENPYKW